MVTSEGGGGEDSFGGIRARETIDSAGSRVEGSIGMWRGRVALEDSFVD